MANTIGRGAPIIPLNTTQPKELDSQKTVSQPQADTTSTGEKAPIKRGSGAGLASHNEVQEFLTFNKVMGELKNLGGQLEKGKLSIEEGIKTAMGMLNTITSLASLPQSQKTSFLSDMAKMTSLFVR